MIKYLKLFKVNIRQNLKIFTSFNIISILSFIIIFLICKFSIDAAIMNHISNGIELTLNLNFKIETFLLFETVLFMLFVLTTIHIRFSDYFGTLYTTMQIPVNRAFHVISIILEAVIFIAIQYVLFYILLKLNYTYILSSLSKIEYSHLYNVYDGFKNTTSINAFGELIPIWNLSIKNIIFRLFISWPAIASYCILFYMIFYKYGVKIVSAIITAILILIIFISNIHLISNIIDLIFRLLFEMIFHNLSSGNIINSILILIGSVLLNSYIIKRKLDF